MDKVAPALAAEYKKKFNREHGLYTLEAYNAAYVLLQGIKAGKTGDPDKIVMNQYTIKNGKMVWVKRLS